MWGEIEMRNRFRGDKISGNGSNKSAENRNSLSPYQLVDFVGVLNH